MGGLLVVLFCLVQVQIDWEFHHGLGYFFNAPDRLSAASDNLRVDNFWRFGLKKVQGWESIKELGDVNLIEGRAIPDFAKNSYPVCVVLGGNANFERRSPALSNFAYISNHGAGSSHAAFFWGDAVPPLAEPWVKRQATECITKWLADSMIVDHVVLPNLIPFGGRCARVPQRYLDFGRLPSLTTPKKHDGVNVDVSPVCIPTTLLGGGNGGLGGQQRFPDKHNPDDRHRGAKHGQDQKPLGPFRHILLSGQVIFGTLIFTGGLYSFLNAYTQGYRIKAHASALYVICGIVMMLFGVYLSAAGLPYFYSLIESN